MGVLNVKSAKILIRKRINAALSSVHDYPLTILEAPMGFGKTTAVKSFVETENINPVWITYRTYGDPITAFWDKFIDAITKVNNQIGTTMKSLGFPIDTPQLDKFLQLMNEVKFSQEMIVIMDDYHFVQNLQLGRLILLLAEEELEGLHILLVTRDTTDINFVELYSKGLCYIISQKLLRFDDSEIKEYFTMMSSNISEYNLKRISEYTEGWISFIYIILIGLENGIPIGMSTTIEDLIETALFDQYDIEVQNFLLILSLMEDFTAKQAEYVTQNENTAVILKKLNKENAFVYYDETNKKYKIHHVLLDFLRLKQNFPCDVLKNLYCRLGEWLFHNNDLMAAYSCYYKAGQIERILQHLNTPSNIRDDLTQFEGSDELFEGARRELLFQYPFAYLQHIFLSLVKAEISCVPIWKERLEELEQYYKKKSNIDESYRNRIISEILIIKKFTLFNHLEEMKASNNEIINLMNGQNSYIAIQENSFTFGSPHYLYLYFRDVGSLKKIADILSAEVGYAKFSNGCGTGCDSLALAEYALETGDFEHLELYCEQTRIKAELKKQTSVVICSRFTLIRYRILEGKISEAMDMLKVLELDAARQNDSIINTTVDLCKGYLYACLGQPERIPVWLQTGDMTLADLMYEGVAFNYLVFGKAVMVSKRYEELDVLTEQFDENFSAYSNQLGFIHNGILKATAKFKLYGLDAGTPFLEAILQEARHDNIVMPFIEAAPFITEMLQIICDKNPNNEFVKHILTQCRMYGRNISKINNNSPHLSQREIEIITLIDQGLSRKQIAEMLYISQETAKTHLKNIYQKLEVNGKVSAVKIAKSKGYLTL